MRKVVLWVMMVLLLFSCGGKKAFDQNALLGLENRDIQVIWSYVKREPHRPSQQETFLLSQKAIQKNQKTILTYHSDEAGFSKLPDCFISIFSDNKMIKNIPFSDFDSFKKNSQFKKLLQHSQKIEMNFKTVEKEAYPTFASQKKNIFYLEERGDQYEVGFFVFKE